MWYFIVSSLHIHPNFPINARMKPEIKKQITVVINQYISQKKVVPHIETLQNHPLYGGFFQELSQEEHAQVAAMIKAIIIEEIETKKTV